MSDSKDPQKEEELPRIVLYCHLYQDSIKGIIQTVKVKLGSKDKRVLDFKSQLVKELDVLMKATNIKYIPQEVKISMNAPFLNESAKIRMFFNDKDDIFVKVLTEVIPVQINKTDDEKKDVVLTYKTITAYSFYVSSETYVRVLVPIPRIEKVKKDALKSLQKSDEISIEKYGKGATAYSQAIAVYITFIIDRLLDSNSSQVGWITQLEAIRNTFGRQAIQMVWDFAEVNPFSSSTGSYESAINNITKAFDNLPTNYINGESYQLSAQTQSLSNNKVISTDPPYYDNIAYADLSDFFYVWLRHNLKPIYPSIFTTLATPKTEELVATAYRHNGKENAEHFFLNGMTEVMSNLANISNQAFPVTIYYAFKQSETSDSGATRSTGWETFLQAIINAGFAINGTWPMRTENERRLIGNGTNALASSIVLVCRRRSENATEISRREFLRELKKVMDEAKEVMTQGDETTSPVAPVDLSQAIIGPGMAVFSKYKAVLEADGSAMSVKEALKLINRYMEENDYDANTLFCKDWYLQYGWEQGVYGEADVLARAKNANLQLLQTNGTIISGQGKVQLTAWKDYKDASENLVNSTLSTWNLLHQFIHELNLHGTEGASVVYARYNNRTADVRSLAYTMYTLCERNDRAEDARVYNELIIAWDDIEAASSKVVVNEQPSLFD